MSYIENDASTVCDTTSTNANESNSKTNSPFRTVKLKSCSSEAYSAHHHLQLTSSPPLSYSAAENSSAGFQHQPTFISPFTSGANQNPSLLNQNDLPFTRNSDQSNQNSNYRQSNSLLKCNGFAGGGTMQTYHIYDDTDRFQHSNHNKCELSNVKRVISNEAPPTPAHRRRKQFTHASSSKGSKSFESPLKTAGDPLKDSFEQEEENHLNNVEQVVKMLSEKLSNAAKEKELLSHQLDTDLTFHPNKTVTSTKEYSSKHSKIMNNLNLESQTRRSSLPQALTTLNSQSVKSTAKLSQECSTVTTSSMQKSTTSLSSNNLDCATSVANLSTLSRTRSLLSGIWKNQSLPASPSQTVTSFKNKLTLETQMNSTVNNANTEKRRSNGRHFFHSPNVIRKMRRK